MKLLWWNLKKVMISNILIIILIIVFNPLIFFFIVEDQKMQHKIHKKFSVLNSDYLLFDKKKTPNNNIKDFKGWPHLLKSKKESSTLLKDHIIVCGNISHIFFFLASLRVKFFENTKWFKQIVTHIFF
jgi:hypothetical protein